MQRHTRFQPRDAGVTLVEMLVAISIGAVVIGVISASLIATFKTQKETTDRLDASHDAQLVGTWLPLDALSAAISGADANDPSTTNKSGPVSAPCAGWPTSYVVLLPFASAPGSVPAGNTPEVVLYRLEPAGTAQQLVRYQCVNSTMSTLVVAHFLTGATAKIQGSGPITVTMTVFTSLPGLSATFTGGGRTGTTLDTLPSTTSPGSSTTTSTSTTLPCTLVSGPSGSPNPVGHVAAPGNKNDLSSPVTVTATSSGSCSGLFIKYSRKNNPSFDTVPMTEGPAGTWSATIPTPGDWTINADHTVSVLTGTTTLGSFTLRVN